MKFGGKKRIVSGLREFSNVVEDEKSNFLRTFCKYFPLFLVKKTGFKIEIFLTFFWEFFC